MTNTSFSLTPLKRLVKRHSGAIKAGPFGSDLTSQDMQGGPVKVYNQRNVIEQDLTAGESYVTEEKYLQLRSFEVQAGDVLVTTRGTIGKILVVPAGAQKGILHPCLIRVQTDESKLNPQYLAWVLQDDEFMREQVKLLSKSSTIDVIYSETLASLRVPCPSLATQTAIADYLDRKTAAIDALIAKKELLIEELRKYLKAATTEAVMRGLSGKASVTPSDENWLGAVPPHWRIVKTARVLRYLKGAAVDKENLAVEGADDSRFLRTGDFWNIRGLSKDKAFVTDTDGLIWKSEGELVFCFDGFNSVAGAGTVGMARFDGAGYIDSHLEKIEVKDDSVAVRRYFEYVLASAFFEHEIVSRARGAIAFSAGYAKYDVSVPVPPITEQQAIVEHLDAVWSTVSPLIEAAKAAIDDLTRYRTALISEAVTGKISV